MIVSYARKFVRAISYFVASLVIGSSCALAAVESISDQENFAQYGQEDAYWTVDVRCQGADSDTTIQRKTNGILWCARGDDNLCSETKSGAAEQVCSDDYVAKQQNQRDAQLRQEREAQQRRERAERERREAAQQLAAQRQREAQQRFAAASQAPPTASTTNNIEEKISIEEQRLTIEQERLKLRRREVELEQRAAEIEELLKDAT